MGKSTEVLYCYVIILNLVVITLCYTGDPDGRKPRIQHILISEVRSRRLINSSSLSSLKGCPSHGCSGNLTNYDEVKPRIKRNTYQTREQSFDNYDQSVSQSKYASSAKLQASYPHQQRYPNSRPSPHLQSPPYSPYVQPPSNIQTSSNGQNLPTQSQSYSTINSQYSSNPSNQQQNTQNNNRQAHSSSSSQTPQYSQTRFPANSPNSESQLNSQNPQFQKNAQNAAQFQSNPQNYVQNSQNPNYPQNSQNSNYPQNSQNQNYPQNSQNSNYPQNSQNQNYPQNSQNQNYPQYSQNQQYPPSQSQQFASSSPNQQYSSPPNYQSLPSHPHPLRLSVHPNSAQTKFNSEPFNPDSKFSPSAREELTTEEIIEKHRYENSQGEISDESIHSYSPGLPPTNDHSYSSGLPPTGKFGKPQKKFRLRQYLQSHNINEDVIVSTAAELVWKAVTSYMFVYATSLAFWVIGKLSGLSEHQLETHITLGKDGRHPFGNYGSKSSGVVGGNKGFSLFGNGKAEKAPIGIKNGYYHPSTALYDQPTYQYSPKGNKYALQGYDQYHAGKYAKKYGKKYSKFAGKYGLRPKPITPYIPADVYGQHGWSSQYSPSGLYRRRGEAKDPIAMLGVEEKSTGRRKNLKETGKNDEEDNSSSAEDQRAKDDPEVKEDADDGVKNEDEKEASEENSTDKNAEELNIGEEALMNNEEGQRFETVEEESTTLSNATITTPQPVHTNNSSITLIEIINSNSTEKSISR